MEQSKIDQAIVVMQDVINKLNAYCENPSMYFDVLQEGLVFPIPHNLLDYFVVALNDYGRHNQLPVLSAVWVLNSSGEIAFKTYAVLPLNAIQAATESILIHNGIGMPEDQTLFIANYYLESEEVRGFKITHNGHKEFTAPFSGTKLFYNNISKN